MDNAFKEKIKSFILEGVGEQPVAARPDPFWQKLKEVGTELWLDTGDMEEAEKNWSAEMTALTTNNTLINKEIQKGIYDAFIADAMDIVKELLKLKIYLSKWGNKYGSKEKPSSKS